MGSFRGPHPGSGKGGPPAARTAPAPRPVKYFENDRLDPELLDKQAEDRAKALKEVTTSQLRRFYEHVLSLDRRLDLECEHSASGGREAAFERLRAEVKMLKAKAMYANGRDARNFPEPFLQFFIDHVHAIKTARDFEAFCKHFQAVVAFHKFYGKND